MASQRLDSLEQIIATDPGQRGIAPLLVPGSLAAAAQSLRKATKVIITTGFFIPLAGRCETDGPPGALCLARALRALGAEVTYLVDHYAVELCRAAGLTPLEEYTTGFLTEGASHLVAIERLGRAADGRYYNMRGLEMSQYTAPIDELFITKPSGQVTIGIGDGGNEIGMGKVCDRVQKHIRFGDRIASTVATDHLIVAGVSNWGAWGLAAALGQLAGRDLLPTPEEAYADLAAVVAAGAVDGVTTESTVTIDGLGWPVHAEILLRLRTVANANKNEPL